MKKNLGKIIVEKEVAGIPVKHAIYITDLKMLMGKLTEYRNRGWKIS